VSAARLHLLSAGAAKGLVEALAPAFEADAGVRIAATFDAAGTIRDAFTGGAPCDVVILPAPMQHALAAAGRVDAASIAALGAVATGVAVANGDPLPAIGDAHALRAALGQAGDRIRLPLLLRIAERVREREGAEPPARRDEWRLARAAAHQALASRGSRLALYDLRETFESAKGRLPVEFLAPLALIGDRTCLEAIAAAHAAARDAWWRQHLADTFYTIVVREQLTARSPILKRVAKKWPGTWTAKARGNGKKP